MPLPHIQNLSTMLIFSQIGRDGSAAESQNTDVPIPGYRHQTRAGYQAAQSDQSNGQVDALRRVRRIDKQQPVPGESVSDVGIPDERGLTRGFR